MSKIVGDVIYMVPPFTRNDDLSSGGLVVYGDWDDTSSYQFAVLYNRVDQICDLYTCCGCDYGGGISEVYSGLDSEALDELIKECRDARDEKGYYKYGYQDFIKKMKSEIWNRGSLIKPVSIHHKPLV